MPRVVVDFIKAVKFTHDLRKAVQVVGGRRVKSIPFRALNVHLENVGPPWCPVCLQDAADGFARRIALSSDCLFMKDAMRMKQWRRFDRMVVLVYGDVSLRCRGPMKLLRRRQAKMRRASQ